MMGFKTEKSKQPGRNQGLSENLVKPFLPLDFSWQNTKNFSQDLYPTVHYNAFLSYNFKPHLTICFFQLNNHL